MRFRLLGGIAVVAHDGLLDLGPARQRCVLAALAVDAGRVVSVDRLTRRVWGEHSPLRARATLLNYLSRLRLLLADAGADAGAAVVRGPGGYSLRVERSAVDLFRFRELCAGARAGARAGDDRRAAALLEQAVGLWRGEALTGVEGEWAAAERDRLHQQLLDAECDLTDALLRLGHGEDLVASLSARAGRWSLDERVAGQFMLALHRAGRTADALAHYRYLRDRLVEQVGTDPGAALRELHRRILDTDPALTPSPAAVGTVAVGGTAAVGEVVAGEVVVGEVVVGEVPVPRQLPAPPRWFTGRATELARLDEALTAEPDGHPLPSGTGSGARAAATVVISAIGGTGGVGKTWLALHWAHRHAEEFPDGQLFVDLRGFSPTEAPVTPDAALFGFLTALGVAPDRIPADLDAKSALFRSLSAGRRTLVVLDNAAGSDQVIPLLPGSPTCTVLVTGRTRPASLIDRHGARHLQLDVLTDDEARELLTRRLGQARIAAEPDATDELMALCGRYPLALTITVRHAAARPAVPLAEFAAELRELGLDALDNDTEVDASLPAVLSWSLRGLTSEQRTVFALLGIAPGPDIDLPAAASLTGLSRAQTRQALRALEDASLLDRHPHGRYAMHDLVRAYAAVTAHDLSESVRRAALRQVVDFYRHTADTAECLLTPHRAPIRLSPPVPGTHPQPLPDQPAALAWLDTHHPHLLAAQHTAVAHRHHQAVWHLAWTLNTFHRRRGHRHDDLAMWQAAADAATHLPDPTTHTHAHRFLGYAHAALGQHEQAIAHLHQALTTAEQHHDPAEQAHTHRALARAWELQGNDRRALEHARHALALFPALDQPAWEADALNQVGWLAARLGDYDTARDHCQAALVLHRHHDNHDGAATTLDSLGYIDHHTGHHHQAIHHYQQALTLRRAVGHAIGGADTLDSLGHPHAALGQHERARAAWQEALELYRELGHDTDAERVRRQLDDLDPAPESIRPSDAAKTAENA